MTWTRSVRRRVGAAVATTAAVALAFSLGLSTPQTATADPSGGPGNTTVSSSDLAQARDAAASLRRQLTDLDHQMQLAHEKLVSVQDQLARVVSRHLNAEQYGDGLAREQDLQQAQAQQRVRDFYMSGGDLGLDLSVLSGQDPVDAYLRVQAVDDAVNGNFATASSDGHKLVTARASARQLRAAASQRARLTHAAEGIVAQLQQLHRQQRAAMSAADQRVRSLVRQYAKQQAAAQSSTAVTSLADLHLSGRQDYVTPYAQAAVAAALSKLGSPYVWGAEGPDTFDCSGLVQWSYAQAGLYVPRVVPDQYAAFTPIPFADLHPGDVIVYGTTPADLYHITMYIGDGLMVEAPHTGDVVKVVPVSLTDAFGAARPGA